MAALFERTSPNLETIAQAFDQKPVLFKHRLQDSNLFGMPALLDLADKAMQKKVTSYYESGEAQVDDNFGHPPTHVTIRQALDQIAKGKNWIILKRIHEVPVYGDFLESAMDELEEITRVKIRRKYYDPILTIFVTSPNRITPYHMDSEANFLAQVQGTKSVHIFDGNDRGVLSSQALERYWTGDFHAAQYREEIQDRGTCFDLNPGLGVFNPPAFPHWVRNGNAVSVSVSINIKRLHDTRVGAHRANYFLRKMRLRPKDPGQSPALDRIKSATLGQAYSAAIWVQKKLAN